MSEEVPDHVKYPHRYANFSKVYQTDDSSQSEDATHYINEWKNKGYTGNYIPEALRQEDHAVEPMAYTPDFDDDSDDRDHTDLFEELASPGAFEVDYSQFVDPSVLEAVNAVKEERAIDPNTGGQKGRKLEEFALVPVWPRQEVARVYGMGAKKYEPHNWRRGYAWSWSLSALYRHIAAFEAGESNDPESGLHHLAHAQFHLNTLMEFERLELGTDDRLI